MSHSGSSKSEIHNEPDWTRRRSDSIRFKNRDGGRTGITDPDHDHEREHPAVDREAEEKEHAQEIADACRMRAELRQKIDSGQLVNFRDVIEHQHSFHLRHPESRSLGWRYVLEIMEDWVKDEEPWPANLERRKMEKKAQEGKDDVNVASTSDRPDEEARRRKTDGNEPQLNRQERTLLESTANEGTYMSHLLQNDGKQHNRFSIAIDEQDQFTPDNWLPRYPALIRLTGESDILLKDELDKFQAESKDQIEITHVLSKPSEEWKGKRGYVSREVIREGLFPPEENSVVFLCGPPGLIRGVALPALREWGYAEDQNMFGF